MGLDTVRAVFTFGTGFALLFWCRDERNNNKKGKMKKATKNTKRDLLVKCLSEVIMIIFIDYIIDSSLCEKTSKLSVLISSLIYLVRYKKLIILCRQSAVYCVTSDEAIYSNKYVWLNAVEYSNIVYNTQY